jgi:choline dehydrogenase-like flavoprotein
MHNRGNFRDFDNWAKLLNNPEWSYDSLLPYFKASENFIGKYKAGEKGMFFTTKVSIHK